MNGKLLKNSSVVLKRFPYRLNFEECPAVNRDWSCFGAITRDTVHANILKELVLEHIQKNLAFYRNYIVEKYIKKEINLGKQFNSVTEFERQAIFDYLRKLKFMEGDELIIHAISQVLESNIIVINFDPVKYFGKQTDFGPEFLKKIFLLKRIEGFTFLKYRNIEFDTILKVFPSFYIWEEIIGYLSFESLKNLRLACRELNILSKKSFISKSYINLDKCSLSEITEDFKNFKTSDISRTGYCREISKRMSNSLIIEIPIMKTKRYQTDFQKFLDKCSKYGLNVFINSFKFLNPIKLVTTQLLDGASESQLLLKADSAQSLFYQIKCLLNIAHQIKTSVKFETPIRPKYKVARFTSTNVRILVNYTVSNYSEDEVMLAEHMFESEDKKLLDLEKEFFKKDIKSFGEENLEVENNIKYFVNEIMEGKLYDWKLEEHVNSLTLKEYIVDDTLLDNISNYKSLKNINFIECNFPHIELNAKFFEFFQSLDEVFIKDTTDMNFMAVEFFNLLVETVYISRESRFRITLHGNGIPYVIKYLKAKPFKSINLGGIVKINDLEPLLNDNLIDQISIKIDFDNLLEAKEIVLKHPNIFFILEIYVPIWEAIPEFTDIPENAEIKIDDSPQQEGSLSVYYITSEVEYFEIIENKYPLIDENSADEDSEIQFQEMPENTEDFEIQDQETPKNAPDSEIVDTEIQDQEMPENAPDFEIQDQEMPEKPSDSEIQVREMPENSPDSEIQDQKMPENTPDSEIQNQEMPENTEDSEIENQEILENAPDSEILKTEIYFLRNEDELLKLVNIIKESPNIYYKIHLDTKDFMNLNIFNNAQVKDDLEWNVLSESISSVSASINSLHDLKIIFESYPYCKVFNVQFNIDEFSEEHYDFHKANNLILYICNEISKNVLIHLFKSFSKLREINSNLTLGLKIPNISEQFLVTFLETQKNLYIEHFEICGKINFDSDLESPIYNMEFLKTLTITSSVNCNKLLLKYFNNCKYLEKICLNFPITPIVDLKEILGQLLLVNLEIKMTSTEICKQLNEILPLNNFTQKILKIFVTANDFSVGNFGEIRNEILVSLSKKYPQIGMEVSEDQFFKINLTQKDTIIFDFSDFFKDQDITKKLLSNPKFQEEYKSDTDILLNTN